MYSHISLTCRETGVRQGVATIPAEIICAVAIVTVVATVR